MEEPLALILRLLLISTSPMVMVLDPFAGSGTVAVGCKILGRRYVGFEMDPLRCETAVKRWKDARYLGRPRSFPE
jgi:DNA modification methylase